MPRPQDFSLPERGNAVLERARRQGRSKCMHLLSADQLFTGQQQRIIIVTMLF